MKLTREILNEMIEREMKERFGLDKDNVEVICESDKEQTPRLTREQLIKMYPNDYRLGEVVREIFTK